MLMRQAATLLAADLSLGELFERLTRMLAEYIDSSVVFIALAKPDGRHAIEYVYDHGEVRRYPHIVLVEPSCALRVIRTGAVIWGNQPSEWAAGGTTPINIDRPWTNDTEAAIFVPMRAGGETIGCLSVQSLEQGAYDEHEVEVVAAIGHYLGVAVQNQRLFQTLARTAEYDPLTGLCNRSKLSSELDAALAIATPSHPVVAIVLDIVSFATFNDTYGYTSGDGVLQLIARALREFEDPDEGVVVGRFGGDVFMVILFGLSLESVERFIARLSVRLHELASLQGDRMLPVSLAFGYVVAPQDATTRSEVVGLAVQRARLSRRQNCRPVRNDPENITLYGSFKGVETIVDALLDGDPYARLHLLHANAMAYEWSSSNLGFDARTTALLLQASLLHDVGMLLIPGHLYVAPNGLTSEQYRRARSHAAYGRTILRAHDGFEEVGEIVAQHHERWDGDGYPARLSGKQIHPAARALAIIEAFSAMVDDRPYHRGVTESAALAELERCSGTQFDPTLVGRFVKWREEGLG